MSFEIYYDRAFLRVGEKYVPLINSGSNNSFEINRFGRRVSEKNWNVLNWKRRAQLLFSEEEIHTIASDYEAISQESGTSFKMRSCAFKKDEFRRWILNGMKNAHTIEEYISYGNNLFILDYSNFDHWVEYPFQTAEQFLLLIDKLKDKTMLSVKFQNNREVYRPKRPRNSSNTDKKINNYYVLVTTKRGSPKYFCSLRKGTIFYTSDIHLDDVRAFSSELEARRYLEKYKERFVNQELKIQMVSKQPGSAA